MQKAIERLVRSGATSTEAEFDPRGLSTLGRVEQVELARLLSQKNGFYAYGGALHVFAFGSRASEDLVTWNSPANWLASYEDLAPNGVCFAEDLFGCQFVIRDRDISMFDPETGELTNVATSVEGWAAAILDDPEQLTGYRILQEWEQHNPPLASGSRLVPVTPFVLGGDYAVSNLQEANASDSMRFRASIALQIRDVPDGSKVVLKAIE